MCLVGVRCVALSSDSSHLVTCSDDSAKVWAVKGLRLVQTLDTPQALCACFILGSYNYVVVGGKDGTIRVCDVAAGVIIDEHEAAHKGNIWAVVSSHDGKTLVSSGADKVIPSTHSRTSTERVVPQVVRFWKLALMAKGAERKLKLVDSHTMEMSDEVLAINLTRNGKLVCIALLDCTVKVLCEGGGDCLLEWLARVGDCLSGE